MLFALFVLGCVVFCLRNFSPEIYDFVILSMTARWYESVLGALPHQLLGVLGFLLFVGLGVLGVFGARELLHLHGVLGGVLVSGRGMLGALGAHKLREVHNLWNRARANARS